MPSLIATDWNSWWMNEFLYTALLKLDHWLWNCVPSYQPFHSWYKYHFQNIKWIKIQTGLSLVYCKPLVGKTDTKGTVQSETMYLTLDLTTISLGGKMDVSRISDDYQVWYELLQPFPFKGQVKRTQNVNAKCILIL